MKGCSYCHRTFHKTEHLLRHERSHTGEKPYHCSTCGRRYARRDVLLRHVKFFHAPSISSHAERNSSDTSTNRRDHRRQSMQADPAGPQSGSQPESESEPELEQKPELEQEPAQQQEPEPGPDHDLASAEVFPTARQLIVPELNALATVSMLQALHDPPSGSADAADTATHAFFDQHLSHGHHNHQHHNHGVPPLNFMHDIVEATLTTATPDLLTTSADILPPDISLSGSAGIMQPQPTLTMDSSCLNDTQNYSGVFEFLQPNLNALNFMDFTVNGNSPGALRGSQASSIDPVSSIPRERFARVARLWPSNRTRLVSQIASNIWTDVVEYRGDNICTDISISEKSPSPTIGNENESKWGMDEGKRQDLVCEFAPDSASSDNNASFPPTRLLNLGLAIVFRHPHSLVSFIHQPTFSAKSASNSIVFSLCLLGLVLLDSNQVKPFTLHYLRAATEKCCVQLAAPLFGPGGSMQLIKRLTSATLLLMAWSICSPPCTSDEPLSRMLYNQAINLAQLSGLMMPRPASSSLDNLLKQANSERNPVGSAENDDSLWKAWARIESLKRLVATLIMTDAWWASSLSMEPLLRTSVVHFEMPTSIDLFQSSSARSWKRLVDGGASIATEPATIQTRVPSICLPASQDTSPVGMAGLLSIVWIQILEHRARRGAMAPKLFTDGAGPYDPPGSVLASNESGNMLLRILSDIYARYSRFLRHKNPNCIALWHFLNLNLVASLDVFELAAGRNGAESAHAALQDIAVWSQTWYARRACLHAAGIYAAMSRRRVSDGTMFHSETSLFVAALVLGLHVFMMQPSDKEQEMHLDAGIDTEPYELLNDIDWASLGDSRMAPLSPTAAVDGSRNNAANRFVRDGGVISFSGTACEGGYNAAKMILLEFSSLLEEVGKWNAKELCHILRIMSDSLLDVDDRSGGN